MIVVILLFLNIWVWCDVFSIEKGREFKNDTAMSTI